MTLPTLQPNRKEGRRKKKAISKQEERLEDVLKSTGLTAIVLELGAAIKGRDGGLSPISALYLWTPILIPIEPRSQSHVPDP